MKYILILMVLFLSSCGSLKKKKQESVTRIENNFIEEVEAVTTITEEIDTTIHVDVPPLILVSETDQADTTYSERVPGATVETQIKDGVKIDRIEPDPVPANVSVRREEKRQENKRKESETDITNKETEVDVDREAWSLFSAIGGWPLFLLIVLVLILVFVGKKYVKRFAG